MCIRDSEWVEREAVLASTVCRARHLGDHGRGAVFARSAGQPAGLEHGVDDRAVLERLVGAERAIVGEQCDASAGARAARAAVDLAVGEDGDVALPGACLLYTSRCV